MTNKNKLYLFLFAVWIGLLVCGYGSYKWVMQDIPKKPDVSILDIIPVEFKRCTQDSECRVVSKLCTPCYPHNPTQYDSVSAYNVGNFEQLLDKSCGNFRSDLFDCKGIWHKIRSAFGKNECYWGGGFLFYPDKEGKTGYGLREGDPTARCGGPMAKVASEDGGAIMYSPQAFCIQNMCQLKPYKPYP
jgi:hypothetical protein